MGSMKMMVTICQKTYYLLSDYLLDTYSLSTTYSLLTHHRATYLLDPGPTSSLLPDAFHLTPTYYPPTGYSMASYWLPSKVLEATAYLLADYWLHTSYVLRDSCKYVGSRKLVGRSRKGGKMLLGR